MKKLIILNLLLVSKIFAQTGSISLVTSNTFYNYKATNDARLNAGTNRYFFASDQATDVSTFPTFSFIGVTNVGIGEVGTNYLGLFTGGIAPVIKLNNSNLIPETNGVFDIGSSVRSLQTFYGKTGIFDTKITIGKVSSILGKIELLSSFTTNILSLSQPNLLSPPYLSTNITINLPTDEPTSGKRLIVTNYSAGQVYTAWGGRQITSIQTLDFPSIAANGNQDLTFTFTGAITNDTVVIGLPSAPNVGVIFQSFVNASDSVTCRAYNYTTNAIDPASANYRFTLQQP